MAKQFYQKPWFWIVIVAVILLLWFFGSYNKLVRLDTEVSKSWSDIQVQYQRRMDLIPNLVNTVKGYAGFEERVITEVTEARSRWQSAVSTGNTPEAIAAARAADAGLGRLIAVAENYPDLKASEAYLSLMDQLEGTENRVAVARERYNKAVTDYNFAVRRVPTNIVAGMFGFGKKELFEARPGAEEVPVVNV